VPSSKRVKLSRANDERDKNPEYTTSVKKKREQEESSSESVVEISSKLFPTKPAKS
jgi:hypothetical protein